MRNGQIIFCAEDCKNLTLKYNTNPYCSYYKTELEGRPTHPERCYACRNNKGVNNENNK